jgi:hypothetical protein
MTKALASSLAIFVSLSVALQARTTLAETGQTGEMTFTQVQVTQLAQASSHFSRTVVIANQRLRIEGAGVRMRSPLGIEQDELANSLREVSSDRNTLFKLLHDADPRVRTIALGAIFEREDGRDLPLIASLVDDDANTIPDLHDSMNQMGGPRPMEELESSQTVGEIARAMLRFWMKSALGNVPESTMNFATYWKRYAGCDHAASWFPVKMKRATGGSFPSNPARKMAIESVLYQIDRLPSPDREWTRLYVLLPELFGWNQELQREESVVSVDEVVATARQLGSPALLRFLQHRQVSTDPDFYLSDAAAGDSVEPPYFPRISDFILLHAGDLLRPQDAQALLVQEQVEASLAQKAHKDGAMPSWDIARAELQPTQAIDILRTAMAARSQHYEQNAIGELAGAMWQIRGPGALGFLTDWFYRSIPSRNTHLDQTEIFLIQVENAGRPDTRQLMTALVGDSRFDQTNQSELRELLKVASVGRATPLVERGELYQYLQAGPREQAMLANWRTLLRREYASQAGSIDRRVHGRPIEKALLLP